MNEKHNLHLDRKNPTFQKIPCAQGDDLCLNIAFFDTSNDKLLLKKVTNEETVLQGKLFEEGSRACAIIEDPNDLDVLQVEIVFFFYLFFVNIIIRIKFFIFS